MLPNIAYFVVPALLLLASLVMVLLWDRSRAKSNSSAPGNLNSDGAFRSIYHQLWVLVFWSGLIFVIPLWVTYKGKISGLTQADRYFYMGKILIFPLLLLVLLRYGHQRGYLRWIQDLQWPDKENK